MKVFRVFLLTSVVLFSVNSPVKASGIPVVDIAGLVQSVLQVTNQLKDYSAQLQNISLQNSQLANMVQRYNQVLTEYQVLLKQVRGLKSVLSAGDYKNLLVKIGVSDKWNPITQNVGVGVYSTAGYQQVDKVVGELYDRSRALGTLATDQSSFSASTAYKDETNRIYKRASMPVSQKAALDTHIAWSAAQQAKIDKMNADVDTIGVNSESELIALQLALQQNKLIINNQKALIQLEQDRFAHENQLSNLITSKEVERRDREIAELKKRQALKAYVPKAGYYLTK